MTTRSTLTLLLACLLAGIASAAEPARPDQALAERMVDALAQRLAAVPGGTIARRSVEPDPATRVSRIVVLAVVPLPALRSVLAPLLTDRHVDWDRSWVAGLLADSRRADDATELPEKPAPVRVTLSVEVAAPPAAAPSSPRAASPLPDVVRALDRIAACAADHAAPFLAGDAPLLRAFRLDGRELVVESHVRSARALCRAALIDRKPEGERTPAGAPLAGWPAGLTMVHRGAPRLPMWRAELRVAWATPADRDPAWADLTGGLLALVRTERELPGAQLARVTLTPPAAGVPLGFVVEHAVARDLMAGFVPTLERELPTRWTCASRSVGPAVVSNLRAP